MAEIVVKERGPQNAKTTGDERIPTNSKTIFDSSMFDIYFETPIMSAF